MTRISSPKQNIEVGLAQIEDAAAIAEMFEAALGAGGILGPGHDPYPEPALFSAEGICSIIDDKNRRLIIVKVGGKPAGGMIIDYLNPHQCEYNCMAVRMDMRGRGIGNLLVRGAKDLVENDLFTMNSTELVTHSMASQASHFGEGYDKITGFGWCHYPRVFFQDHPESVLWVTRPQGHLVEALLHLRRQLGRELARKDLAASKQVKAALEERVHHFEAVAALHTDKAKPYEYGDLRNVQELCAEILRRRPVYVPPAYRMVTGKILAQFEEVLDYDVDAKPDATDAGNREALAVDFKQGYEHSYLVYAPGFKFSLEELERGLNEVWSANKRFVLVRIPVNESQSVEAAEQLRKRGFFFHSVLPLYGHERRADGSLLLFDILTLQWVSPQQREKSPLPGETQSPVKLYGYPMNLSGDIIRLIRSEVAAGAAQASLRESLP